MTRASLPKKKPEKVVIITGDLTSQESILVAGRDITIEAGGQHPDTTLGLNNLGGFFG